jgi:hypothetical protein
VAALLVLAGLGCFSASVTWTLRTLLGGMERVLRQEDVHRLALRAAEASPQATTVLGAPLTSSALTLRAHGSTAEGGLVDFDLEVEGPRGRGVLRTQVAYDWREWTLRRLVLRPEGGPEVELPAVGSTPARSPD